MAESERNNLPIAENPEFTAEIPAIRPDDPVHFAQMNAMLASLLGNDVFLEKLANKMIEKTYIAHILDCENPQMVLGADQAPRITGLIDGVKEEITQLYSDIQLDFSNASPDVQNLQTFLQKTLLALWPLVVNFINTLPNEWLLSSNLSGITPYVKKGDGYIRFGCNCSGYATSYFELVEYINIGVGAKLSYDGNIYNGSYGDPAYGWATRISMAVDNGSYTDIDSHTGKGVINKAISNNIDLSAYAGKSVKLRITHTKNHNADSYVQFSKLAIEYA